MKLFKSIKNWFFSEEREEIKKLVYNLEQVTNSIAQVATENKNPIKSARMIGTTLVVVLKDGSILEKENATQTDFDQIKVATTLSDIGNILMRGKEIENKEEEEDVFSEFAILEGHDDFLVDKSRRQVFFKGIGIAMPNVIAASFVEILEKNKSNLYNKTDLKDSYDALVMFWLKLALNPIESSRNDILNFIKKNDVHITKYGNMVLYRRIVSKGRAKQKVAYFNAVSTGYATVKRNKKSPKNYLVYEDGKEFKYAKYTTFKNDTAKVIGNLQKLYESLKEDTSNEFTAYYDSSVSIKIGDIYSIPEDKINLNNGLCAAGGLHAAAVDYNYSGFGDTPVVVLVSPSKAITVPKNETGKLRTTEMFIVCINDKPLGTHFDDNGIFQFDEKYHAYTLTQLESDINSKSFTTVSIKDSVPELTMKDLQEIRNQLKQRITKI